MVNTRMFTEETTNRFSFTNTRNRGDVIATRDVFGKEILIVRTGSPVHQYIELPVSTVEAVIEELNLLVNAERTR